MKKKLKLDLSKGIKRLQVTTNRLVNTGFVGTYKSVFRGRGLEFEGYRQYTPDDDASIIDWKASVKSKELLVREFVEERNLSIYMMIDVSSSMIYGSTEKLKIEYAAEISATLSYAVLNAGDGVGFALFNDKVIKDAPPVSGYKQHHNIIKTLVNPNYYGGGYNLNEALRFSLSTLKNISVFIIISDFIGLTQGWDRYIRMLSKKFDVIGIMVRDPRDYTLPDYKGHVVLCDPYSNNKITIKPSAIKEQYKRFVLKQEETIKKVFSTTGADFLSLSTEQSFIKPLTSLFIKRTKRMR